MRMKGVLFLLAFLWFTPILTAQEEEFEADDTVGISGYISPFFHTTSMIKPSYFFGGSGAILLNPNFFLGGFGVTMTNYLKTDRGEFTGNELDFGGGGLIGGIIFWPSKKIHPVVTLWGGAGSISLSDKNKVRIKEAFDDFYYFNGTFEVEYRVMQNLAIGIGAHYQQISGFKLDGYSENDFCGSGIYFNIKAGVF